MSRQDLAAKLGVSLVAVLAVAVAGCKFGGMVSTSTASPKTSKKSKAECKKELTANEGARMPCIIDNQGNSNRVGETITFTCPTFETSRWTWVNGSDPFPLASSICYAAAYVGKIKPEEGGEVTIEILAQQTVFPKGELKNGIKSQEWNGGQNGSHGFRIVP